MPNESSSGETANSNQVSQRGRVARRFSVMRARGCCSIKRWLIVRQDATGNQEQQTAIDAGKS